MAASGLLPVTPDLPTLRAKLQGLLRFLGDALAIANAHTVDFYTESLWEELVDLAPEAALAALQLRREAGPWDAQPRGHAAAGPGGRRAGREGQGRARGMFCAHSGRGAPSGGSTPGARAAAGVCPGEAWVAGQRRSFHCLTRLGASSATVLARGRSNASIMRGNSSDWASRTAKWV